VAIHIDHMGALLFYSGDSLLGHIAFYLWVDRIEHSQFIALQRSSGIAFDTTRAVAFAKVAHKFFLNQLLTYQYGTYFNHHGCLLFGYAGQFFTQRIFQSLGFGELQSHRTDQYFDLRFYRNAIAVIGYPKI